MKKSRGFIENIPLLVLALSTLTVGTLVAKVVTPNLPGSSQIASNTSQKIAQDGDTKTITPSDTDKYYGRYYKCTSATGYGLFNASGTKYGGSKDGSCDVNKFCRGGNNDGSVICGDVLCDAECANPRYIRQKGNTKEGWSCGTEKSCKSGFFGNSSCVSCVVDEAPPPPAGGGGKTSLQEGEFCPGENSIVCDTSKDLICDGSYPNSKGGYSSKCIKKNSLPNNSSCVNDDACVSKFCGGYKEGLGTICINEKSVGETGDCLVDRACSGTLKCINHKCGSGSGETTNARITLKTTVDSNNVVWKDGISTVQLKGETEGTNSCSNILKNSNFPNPGNDSSTISCGSASKQFKKGAYQVEALVTASGLPKSGDPQPASLDFDITCTPSCEFTLGNIDKEVTVNIKLKSTSGGPNQQQPNNPAQGSLPGRDSVGDKEVCSDNGNIKLNVEFTAGSGSTSHKLVYSVGENANLTNPQQSVSTNSNHVISVSGFSKDTKITYDVVSCNSSDCVPIQGGRYSTNGYYTLDTGNPPACSSTPGGQQGGDNGPVTSSTICQGHGGPADTSGNKGYEGSICLGSYPTESTWASGKFDASKASSGAYEKANYYDVYKCSDGSAHYFVPKEGDTPVTGVCNVPPWTKKITTLPPPGKNDGKTCTNQSAANTCGSANACKVGWDNTLQNYCCENGQWCGVKNKCVPSKLDCIDSAAKPPPPKYKPLPKDEKCVKGDQGYPDKGPQCEAGLSCQQVGGGTYCEPGQNTIPRPAVPSRFTPEGKACTEKGFVGGTYCASGDSKDVYCTDGKYSYVSTGLGPCTTNGQAPNPPAGGGGTTPGGTGGTPNFHESGACDSAYFTCENSCPAKQSSVVTAADNAACREAFKDDASKWVCCLKPEYAAASSTSQVASQSKTAVCASNLECVQQHAGASCVFYGESLYGICQN